MERGERRYRADKIAQRRFEVVAGIESRFARLEGLEDPENRENVNWYGKEMSPGFFKKFNPLTHPKVPKRGWQKKNKARKAKTMAERRNLLPEDEI
jgi:hypothetical protein